MLKREESKQQEKMGKVCRVKTSTINYTLKKDSMEPVNM